MKNIKFLLSKIGFSSSAEEVHTDHFLCPLSHCQSPIQAGKSCLEMCLNVVLLSAAMVGPLTSQQLLLLIPVLFLLPSSLPSPSLYPPTPLPFFPPSPTSLSSSLPLCLLDSSLLSQVMSGSGDLEVLRVVRRLRTRFYHPEVTYGSQMATHMALGLLFLGGCRWVDCHVL